MLTLETDSESSSKDIDEKLKNSEQQASHVPDPTTRIAKLEQEFAAHMKAILVRSPLSPSPTVIIEPVVESTTISPPPSPRKP